MATMFDSDSRSDAATETYPNDGDMTLRHNAPATHEHPATSGAAAWAFFGGLSMPGSEHLIPQRN